MGNARIFIDTGDIAELKEISNTEKVAVIVINNEYYTDPQYGVVWNLDTALLHELIHVVLDEQIGRLAKKVRNNKKFREDFEEFICDKFAWIIYNHVKNRRKKMKKTS